MILSQHMLLKRLAYSLEAAPGTILDQIVHVQPNMSLWPEALEEGIKKVPGRHIMLS